MVSLIARSAGFGLGSLLLLGGAGCGHRLIPGPIPAGAGALACVLSELGQRGYAISAQSSGALWYQAVRTGRAGGEEIWIRLVDDGTRPAWLDLRESHWNQAPAGPILEGRTIPVVAPLSRSESSQEVGTVLELCKGR